MYNDQVKLKYCPPFIYAHRVYLEKLDKEISTDIMEQKFGDGGALPSLDSRWKWSKENMSNLIKWDMSDCSGYYYGFRTRDDQIQFYLTFAGKTVS